MKKMKVSSWLLIGSIPFDVAAIIIFGARKLPLGGVLLAVGATLYIVGLFLASKERKAEQTTEAQAVESTEETTEAAETAETVETTEEQA